MRKRQSARALVQKRVQKWEEEDPSLVLSNRIESASQPLQALVALLIPDKLIESVTEQALQLAESLTSQDDVLKEAGVSSLDALKQGKIEHADAAAGKTQTWATAAAAALGAWDLAGPLGIAPALASLFTLSFRTIKKIGLCFGYDTSASQEELIVLEIFAAAAGFNASDKKRALEAIAELCRGADGATAAQENTQALVVKLSSLLARNLTRRRVLACVPVVSALAGSSTNAWLLNDVCWAARNVYAARRFKEAVPVVTLDNVA